METIQLSKMPEIDDKYTRFKKKKKLAPGSNRVTYPESKHF